MGVEPRTYTCASCGQTFEYEDDWTEDDAQAEYEAVFSEGMRHSGQAVVCDDCYRTMMGALDA